MANREALRELQVRLASRLQAARSEGISVAWLAVRVGGQNLLFPLGQSGEIFPLASLQPVPYAREWFRGVINIRGGLYGVVDLAAFIAFDTGQVRAVPPAQDPSVVTLNVALEVNVALQVDALLGLRGVEAFASSSPPDAGAPAYFGNQFLNIAGEHWQEIDMRILSQTQQFLSISA
jgi:twitching motility protein PilI